MFWQHQHQNVAKPVTKMCRWRLPSRNRWLVHQDHNRRPTTHSVFLRGSPPTDVGFESCCVSKPGVERFEDQRPRQASFRGKESREAASNQFNSLPDSTDCHNLFAEAFIQWRRDTYKMYSVRHIFIYFDYCCSTRVTYEKNSNGVYWYRYTQGYWYLTGNGLPETSCIASAS